MFEKISERDKRTLKLGVAAMIIILGYAFAWPQIDDWLNKRTQLKARQAQLQLIAGGKDEKTTAAAEALDRAVPVFEMPTLGSKQAKLFRDEFNEQVKRAGIKVKTLQPVGGSGAKRIPGRNVKRLKYQCRGRGSLNQVFDLLAGLNSNPYLAGIEDISLKVDQKDRRQIDMVLTVSTFVK